jgi:guanosine-3',5'-bis(diphosphate) 3'-pyrophosphohydrolase
LSHLRSEDLRKIQKAYWFSKNVHRPQQRDSGERYFDHPVRVARMLISLRYDDPDMICTALLHDVVEDTYTPDYVIVDLFGPEVWANITLLTKKRPMLDPVTLELIGMTTTNLPTYFEKIGAANKAVRLVKVADRIDNTTDLPEFKPERQKRYIDETVQWILPIADNTDPVLASLLRGNLKKVDPQQES